MIIKVQLSLTTSYEKQQMMAYNQDESVLIQEDASKDMKDIMHGRPKAFFNAEMVDGKLTINGEAPWQDW